MSAVRSRQLPHASVNAGALIRDNSCENKFLNGISSALAKFFKVGLFIF